MRSKILNFHVIRGKQLDAAGIHWEQLPAQYFKESPTVALQEPTFHRCLRCASGGTVLGLNLQQ